MGKPAAKQGDQITAIDSHIILVPSASGTTPVLTPGHQFNGVIDNALSPNVKIMGMAAAMQNSTATNTPPHIPMTPGSFQLPPANQGTITQGSKTVYINGRPAARNGDPTQTCADPSPNMGGSVIATGTVFIGD